MNTTSEFRRSLPTAVRLRLFAAGWDGPFAHGGVGPHGDPLLCWAIQACPLVLPDLVPVLDAPDLNRTDVLGRNALMWACQCAPAWVEPLIRAGVDVGLPDHHGWTPLMVACQDRPGAVPSLLNAGADPHQKSQDGTTALMVACRNSPSAVPLLLAAGCSVGDEDDRGCSAWSIAMRERPEVVPLLDRARQVQDMNTPSETSRRPRP